MSRDQIKLVLREHVSLMRDLLPDMNIKSIYDSSVYTDIFVDDLLFFNRHMGNGKVLDFGCGRGTTSFALANLGLDVTGLDIAAPDQDNAKTSYVFSKSIQDNVWSKTIAESKSLNFKFYAGNKIPFEDNTFDAVFAYAVLEHVDDLEYTLKEIHRVLAPEGILFISRTPNKGSYLEILADKLELPAHENRYSKMEILTLLKDAGFFVDDFELIDFFPALIPGNERMNEIYQKGSAGLLLFDKIIRLTPLRYVAHHFRILAHK